MEASIARSVRRGGVFLGYTHGFPQLRLLVGDDLLGMIYRRFTLNLGFGEEDDRKILSSRY